MAKGTLSVVWIDPGNVNSAFMSGLFSVVLALPDKGIKLDGLGHQVGIYVDKQRQQMFDSWADSGSDWILWVDSDIVISPESFFKLWDAADEVIRPIISGIAMVSMNPNSPLMTPNACVYKVTGDNKFDPVHPLPENQVISIDACGFGYLLMHKSVAAKLRKKYTDGVLFNTTLSKDGHIGEDISFFYKCREVGIPVHAHTGATSVHMKTFHYDINYYKWWWATIGPNLEQTN